MTWTIDRNGCGISISTVHLSMSVSSLNQHLKKRTRLGKMKKQINFLLCVSAGPMLSPVSAALVQRLPFHSICYRTILAIRTPIDNIKADSKNSYKCSNQIADLTLKPFCVCDFMVGRLSLTIWYYMMAIQWAWIMTYSQAGKYAELQLCCSLAWFIPAGTWQ